MSFSEANLERILDISESIRFCSASFEVPRQEEREREEGRRERKGEG
jgi:hypothetical protein